MEVPEARSGRARACRRRRRCCARRLRVDDQLDHEEDRLQVRVPRARARVAARPHRAAVRRSLQRVDGVGSRGAATRRARGRRRDRGQRDADARIVRGGTERWLVVKATPQQAWNTMRKFWIDIGFVLAVEQPDTRRHGDRLGREPRRHAEHGSSQGMIGKVADVFFNSYKRDKFRTRIERAPSRARSTSTFRTAAPSRCRRPDRQPLAGRVRVDRDAAQSRPRSRDAGTRLMVRFGAAETQAAESAVQAATGVAERTRARAAEQGRRRLAISSSSTTASTARGAASVSRSTASASPSSIATAPRASTSSATPIRTPTARRRTGLPRQAAVLEDRHDGQARAVPDHRGGGQPRSLGDRAGSRPARPTRRATGEKILSLLRDQLK